MSEQFLELPFMPLREIVVFPQNVQPLFVGRPYSIMAIEAAFATQARQIFLLAQKNSSIEEPDEADLFSIGTAARILQKFQLPDGTLKILCEGLFRAKLKKLAARPKSFPMAQIITVEEKQGNAKENDVLANILNESLKSLDTSSIKFSRETLESIASIKKPGMLADAVLRHLNCGFKKKQELLEALDITERLEKTLCILEAEKEHEIIEKRIKNRIKLQMEQNQREYYLAEQIKAIRKEMGKDADTYAEIDLLEEKIKKQNFPDHVQEKLLLETGKMRCMTPGVAEYSVSRSYIDWIMELPWNKQKTLEINQDNARAVLNKEHFGLEKAKERILEYLAVQKLSGSLKGSILCLAGPPGVGKTSLAKSVAIATGRDFIRISLGGVRDEAEIRGHRRTYVGALPGKIIQALRRVKFCNPLVCLDEIDKISSGYRGDPQAALLEVLDPEQNYSFMDHYLDLEYDLSEIFFITTANSLQDIPKPLLDRMEVIEIPAYLETEKNHIAKNFLLPKQLKAHGLMPKNLKISDSSITDIIRQYTHESGVRNLERELAALCRKAAAKIVKNNSQDICIAINSANLNTYLGAAKFCREEREKEPKIGVCTGLAWNPYGGSILFIETSVMSGCGKIVATGQLGEIMKESAEAALSYVRSHAHQLGLNEDFYRHIDIHVHVPQGATPKDGPSAGIALATSITSALLGIPVRNDLAMTGEISLRGLVLPVGGLREKLLAAKLAGIFTVILPKDNKKDLRQIPQELIKGLEIIYAAEIDEVLITALKAEKEEIFPEISSCEFLLKKIRQN